MGSPDDSGLPTSEFPQWAILSQYAKFTNENWHIFTFLALSWHMGSVPLTLIIIALHCHPHHHHDLNCAKRLCAQVISMVYVATIDFYPATVNLS